MYITMDESHQYNMQVRKRKKESIFIKLEIINAYTLTHTHKHIRTISGIHKCNWSQSWRQWTQVALIFSSKEEKQGHSNGLTGPTSIHVGHLQIFLFCVEGLVGAYVMYNQLYN